MVDDNRPDVEHLGSADPAMVLQNPVCDRDKETKRNRPRGDQQHRSNCGLVEHPATNWSCQCERERCQYRSCEGVPDRVSRYVGRGVGASLEEITADTAVAKCIDQRAESDRDCESSEIILCQKPSQHPLARHAQGEDPCRQSKPASRLGSG